MMAVVSLVIGIGGMLLSALMKPKQKDTFGPRLADVNVPSVSPGNVIPRLWGTMKLGAQVVWVSRLMETAHVQPSQGGKGGGKGGGGKGGPSNTTYTYAVDVALGVCRGPVHQINRIWANQKLLWVNPNLASQAQQAFDAAYQAEFTRLVDQEYMVDYDMAYASAFFFAFNNYRQDEYTYGTQGGALAYITSHPARTFNPPRPEIPNPDSGDVNALLGQMLDGLGHDMQYANYKIRFDQLDIYLGDDTQTPNSKMESWIGVGNVPAYRGVCYFVVHNLQLEDFGDAVPTFNVEVQQSPARESTYLYQVVNDICDEAGLDPKEYDTASYLNLDAKMDGFAITQSTTPRDAIGQLQKVFPFDAAETNYKLVFSWINQRPRLVLRREDFGAHVDSDSMPTSEEVKRIHDLDLPRRINLKFQERARNYSPNMVFASRQATESSSIDDREITIALDRADAKKWAEEQLALAFTARRSYKILLPRKYAIIEPGDVVLAPDKDYADTRYGLRCIETNIGNNGIVEATFIDHFYHVDMSAEVADDNDGAYTKAPVDFPKGSSTIPYLIDCPLLTDSEADNVGFYAVLGGTSTGWLGGVLMIDMGQGQTVQAYNQETEAASSGANWTTLTTSSQQSPHGYAMSLLDPNCKPMMWDRVSQLTVYMRNRDFTLASATEVDLLTQPLNMCLVGDEVIQYANATDLGNGVWRLDTLLRGLRGTEASIKTHSRGERWVRLRALSTKRITHDQRYINTRETFRAMTFGDSSENATSFYFTNTGNSLRPRAPQLRTCYREDSGDVTLTWIPRARQNGNLVSGREVALDQDVEAYEIDVVIDGVVKKTHTVSERSWTYTAADQGTDLGGVASVITFRLYQLGRIVGRGYVSEITL